MPEKFLPPGYSFELLNNMSVFKSYLEFGEANIEKEIERNHKAYKENSRLTYKMIEDDPERFNDERVTIEDIYWDNFYMMDMEIRSRFRQSLIIQLYSFMEVFLYKQCEQHKIINRKEYSVKDLNGHNDLDKVAKYYQFSVGVEIRQMHHWQFINNLRKLRNIIVHKEGRINDKDSYNGIKNFAIGNFELMKWHDEYEYQIVLSERKFIENCIDEINIFLMQLVII